MHAYGELNFQMGHRKKHTTTNGGGGGRDNDESFCYYFDNAVGCHRGCWLLLELTCENRASRRGNEHDVGSDELKAPHWGAAQMAIIIFHS